MERPLLIVVESDQKYKVSKSYEVSKNNPLPLVQSRKKSFIDDEQKIQQKTAKYILNKNNHEEYSNKTSKLEKNHIKNSDIQKQLKDLIQGSTTNNTYKKRVIVSPNKIIIRDKLYETLEHDILKQQIEQLRKCEVDSSENSSQIPFSFAIRQSKADQDEYSKKYKFLTEKLSSNKAFLYQPYKKKSHSQKEKLKPIVSQTHIRNDEPYFFSVEKINLIDLEKQKKINSVILNSIDEKTGNIFLGSLEDKKQRQLQKLQRNELNKHNFQKSMIKNSKLIRQINIIRDKFNIQKINQINNDIEHEKNQLYSMQRMLNIKSIEPLINNEQTYINTNDQNSIFTIKPIRKNTEQPTSSFLNEKIGDEEQDSEDKFDQNQMNIKKAISYIEKVEEEDDKNEKKDKNELSPLKKRKKKFTIPFETYHYRNLIWKINFSNSLAIETPLEYEHRLKVFVGKGNNSCMVSGYINRRYWFAFTDKIQEANFVWTQLKQLPYYKKQDRKIREIIVPDQEEKKYLENSLLNIKDYLAFKRYIENFSSLEERCDERLFHRVKNFKFETIIKTNEVKEIRMHNHLINNYVIGNKKALFNTMSNYYQEINQEVFNYLPLTFHVKEGLQDKVYYDFLKYFYKRAKQISKNNSEKDKKDKQFNAWILKPGQNSNRGRGIQLCLNLQEIKTIIRKRQKYSDGSAKTYIIQSYIQKPLLYYRRKFDLRHYIMISSINGLIKGYWYKDGYVRTTSSEYNLNTNAGSIHLTNDAVQKNLPDYGKFQKGNKISYQDLDAYIAKHHKYSQKGGFYSHVYPAMKKIAIDSIKACSGGIDPDKLTNNFQIFGMDFMIDANLDVWLIQINTNPCLEISCPLLGSIIPRMIQNTLELTLDAMFPPPVRYAPKGVHYFKDLEKQNKFQLVYDEKVEKLYKGSLQVLDNRLLEEEDDTFQDDGDQWEDS